MTEISKADWKLFRVRLAEWQEAHMERLTHEYIKLLQGEGNASDKFWALEKRIREDKKTPGVQLELRKSRLVWDLRSHLYDGVITDSDLNEFSEELKEEVLRYRGEF